MFRVSVLGATGYTGRELLHLISRHADVELAHATTTSKEGLPIGEAHPSLRGIFHGTLEAFDARQVARDSHAVLSCLPHKESQRAIGPLLQENPRIKAVDLSGDFRFKNAADYEAAYGIPHVASHLLPRAAYGIPELFRDQVRSAPLVANPGCYPTSVLLALAPFCRAGLVEGDVIVDSKSGLTGAGASPSPGNHYPEANESLKAYNALAHRHAPEMAQQLTLLGADSIDVQFVPHLVPMNRGIHSTIYLNLATPQTPADVQDLLSQAYASEPFVRVLPQGQLPETKHVQGTNFCDVGFALHPNGRRLVLCSVLDNLVKGASGQAIQNLNLLLGLDETAALLPPVHRNRAVQVVA